MGGGTAGETQNWWGPQKARKASSCGLYIHLRDGGSAKTSEGAMGKLEQAVHGDFKATGKGTLEKEQMWPQK